MEHPEYKKIVRDESFIGIVKKKRVFAISLTILVLIIYASFMAIATFSPNILGKSIDGSYLTVGIPVSALVIIACWAITGFYIYITNKYFDKKVEEIKKEYHND